MQEFKTRIAYAMRVRYNDFEIEDLGQPDEYELMINYIDMPAYETRESLARSFFGFICSSAGYDNWNQIIGYQRTREF